MNDVRPAIMPKAREDRLIIKELPDETLVYDLVSDQAHCLNHTAALVWQNCNGERTVAEISASIASQTETPVDEGVVWLALEQLERFKLLIEVAETPMDFAGINRRQLIRTVGIAAFALPLITSIVAPTAVEAQSCVPPLANNCTCTASSQCASGCCKKTDNLCGSGGGAACV